MTLDPYEAWDERPVGDPRQTPRAAIMDAILGVYGLVRLTGRADEYLGLALDLAD